MDCPLFILGWISPKMFVMQEATSVEGQSQTFTLVVRVHPVTGAKSLFVNEPYTQYIVGLKKEESDAILRFLFDHIARSADIQVRIKWENKTVVVWDNRITAHSALYDFDQATQRRHVVRITPRGEQPKPVGN